MKRERRAVALVIDSLSSEYSVYVRRAVERAASARGVDVLTVVGQRFSAPTVIESTQNALYDLVGPETVDGIIVVSSTVGHYVGREGVEQWCRKYAPLPVCSIGVALDRIPSLVVDNVEGADRGASHLLDVHRCRRIAFIAAQAASIESNQRLQGFLSAHQVRGVTIDERLIVHGEFTIPSGAAAMRALLHQGVAFDAVMAANDDMALGALDVLREHGRQVPRDVLVVGFDDINSAHFTRPSLSTLRQPMWWLGAEAVEAILRQLDGEAVASCAAGSVEFVRRESCGCGYQVAESLRPTRASPLSWREFLRDERRGLEEAMHQALTLPRDALGAWPGDLLDALGDELSGIDGRFCAVFEDLLERAQAEGASLDEFQRLVSTMRTELRWVQSDDALARKLERIWHAARILVGAVTLRAQGRQRLHVEQVASGLGRSAERLGTTLSLPLLKQALLEELPGLRLSRGAVSLYSEPPNRLLEPLVALSEGREVPESAAPFPEHELAPNAVLFGKTCQHSIVLPISFESQVLGVAVFNAGAVPSVYETLRQQIGSAIKGAMLHRRIVAEVSIRTRMEQERLSEEARLAADIQNKMGPSALVAEGLELAAVQVCAAEAGGDYYDVIPAVDGAWIAIGDVTGHGLAAGLVMLMLQSMITALVRATPEPSPSQVISVVNEGIYENVRFRLKRDDHATLTVFRYHSNGIVRFAGAHEDTIIWRAATGRCELVPTPGIWVGAVPNVRAMTEESELRLEVGDLIVLYTDGVTEPRNAQHEQYSVERLALLVQACAELPVDAIRDRILSEVKRWSSTLDDDVTLLVGRYHGDRSSADAVSRKGAGP